MKKIVTFAIMAVILLSLCSCGQKGENTVNNLLIKNESTAEIASIGIYVNNQSHGVKNADNSVLKKGDVLGFHIDETRDCIFRIEIHDKDGNLISQREFTKDFTNMADEKVYLYIRDDENGKPHIIDYDARGSNTADPFTPQEVAAAKAVVERYFKAWADKDDAAWWATWNKEKPANAARIGDVKITLKDIRYDPQDNMRENYVTNGGGNVNNTSIENVIVFKCDFNVQYHGSNTGAWNEGDYSGWSVILVRQNAGAGWFVADHGY